MPSAEFAERYRLTMPADLAAWLDDEPGRSGGGAEFRNPLSLEQLLNPDRETLWAGFMLPDTLPLIGNDYGDWLCLRVHRDGSIGEVLYWCHGGGDWLPYGRSLAEALLYDAAFGMLYRQRHDFVSSEAGERPFALAEWAANWIGRPETFVHFWDQPAVDPLEELLAAGVAEVAARRDLTLRHLASQLKSRSDPQVARELGASWEPEFVSWLFDTALIPELRKRELSNRFEMPASELTQQDWEAAEADALKVLAMRDDLGWAFDIAGWGAERRGDVDLAIQRYYRGARASLFADDSVTFRTHWFSDGYGKFTAARLAQLREHLPPDIADDPYLHVFWQNDPESLRPRLRDYWMDRAAAAETAGRPWDAYRAYYAAGWDAGLQLVQGYDEVFAGLVRSAEAAESPALAAVARTHQQLLAD